MIDWVVACDQAGWMDEEALQRAAIGCEAAVLRRRVGLTVLETRLRAVRILNDAERFRVQTILLRCHTLEAVVVGRGDGVCRFYPRDMKQQAEAIARAMRYA